MKKLKILLFTFIFMFLSIPNVFADWNIITVNKIEMSKGNSYSTYNVTSRVYDNIAFRGALVEEGGKVTKGTYYLTNPNFLDSSKKYSITFFIYWGSVSYGSSTDNLIEAIPPLVTLDSNSCYVKPLGTNGGQYGSTDSSMFNVVCDNYTPSSNPIIEVYSNSTPAIGTLYFGVQNGWGYSIANSELNDIISSTENIESSLGDLNSGVNDLNQNITNDDVNNVEGTFDSFEGFIAENSTITQLITMPITLYTSILNGMQSTCQPFVLGNLFGTNLTIPCINIGNYLGTVLWTMIDIIISGFAIFAISKKLIKIFNNFSSMKEGDVIDD